MLDVKIFSNPREKEDQINAFLREGHSVIVPNTVTKNKLQNFYFKSGATIIEENELMAAGEFFKKISLQVIPEISLISSEILESLVRSWISEDKDIDFNPSSVNNLLEHIELFLPIISDPSHREVLSQWFKENKNSYLRWGRWYEVSYIFWKKIEDSKFITTQFLPAYLLQKDLNLFNWPKKIIFDFGMEASLINKCLMEKLSQNLDVVCIQSQNPEEQDSNLEIEKKIKLCRVNTELSEVKLATTCVRNWLDQGVSLAKIAVFAPNIEVYRTALQSFFKKEGVPFLKTEKLPLKQVPQIISWLARLRIASGQVSTGDLEVSEYGHSPRKTLRFSEFKNIFSTIYDSQDLLRNRKIKNLYLKSFKKDSLSRDEFINFFLDKDFFKDSKDFNVNEIHRISGNITGGIKSNDTRGAKDDLQKREKETYLEYIEIILKDFLAYCPKNIFLNLSEWILFLDKSCSKIQIKIGKEEVCNGIHFLNLADAEYTNCSHSCFLGLTKSQMEDSKILISLRESEKLLEDTGFILNILSSSRKEEDLKWATNLCEKSFYITSDYDFLGKEKTPSKYWLDLNQDIKVTEVKEVCRWDSLQNQNFEDLNKILEADRIIKKDSNFINQIKADLGEISQKNVTPLADLKLSASSFESYGKCPFIFTAKKLFKLSDESPLDIDLSPLKNGSFSHKIFKKIVEEGIHIKKNRKEIEEMIEDLYKEEKYFLIYPNLWLVQKEKYVKLALNFINEELKDRANFFTRVNLKTEFPIDIYWNYKNSEFSNNPKDALPFTGRIDRIDGDGKGRYIIIDYKSARSSTLNHWGTWIKKNNFQLGLYSKALESQCVEGLGDKEKRVVGSFYYSYRDWIRNKGFHLEGECEDLYGVSSRGSKMSSEKNYKFYDDLSESASKIVASMMSGKIDPQPQDKTKCNECKWSRLCRAPHLNN